MDKLLNKSQKQKQKKFKPQQLSKMFSIYVMGLQLYGCPVPSPKTFEFRK